MDVTTTTPAFTCTICAQPTNLSRPDENGILRCHRCRGEVVAFTGTQFIVRVDGFLALGYCQDQDCRCPVRGAGGDAAVFASTEAAVRFAEDFRRGRMVSYVIEGVR